jgi:uncharacterized protein YegP (UPF0339 family)
VVEIYLINTIYVWILSILGAIKGGNTMTGKFEIYMDKSGKFRWRLSHVNGIVIARSGKSHPTKANAVRDIWGALAATSGN